MATKTKVDSLQGGDEPTVSHAGSIIRYNFIKSNHFRVVLAEGAYGGISPTGHIRMAVFNERFPLPQQTEHSISADGKIGQEIPGSRVARDGIVREIEVELVMDIEHAKQLQEWLGAKIAELSKVHELLRSQQQ
jgi:hypothetical protein